MDDQQTWRRRTLLHRAGTGALALASLGAAGGTVAATDSGSDGTGSDLGSPPAARQAAAASATRWPQFQADAANSGYTETAGPTEGSVNWTHDTGEPGQLTKTVAGTATPVDGPPDDPVDNVVSSPAVVDGTVYVGSNEGVLYALDAVSGDEEWTYEANDEIMSSPAVLDGTVYVGSHDNHLHAVDAQSGEGDWTVETDGSVFASPTYHDGTLYVGSQNGTMYAVDTDGSEVWNRALADRIDSTAAVVEDKVFVGLWNTDHTGSVVALDVGSGEEVNRYPARGEIACSPTVTDGVVYFGDYAGVIYAVDVESEELVWGREFGDPILASPVVVDGSIFVCGFDGTLWVMDAANGDVQWSFATKDQIFSSPAVTPDAVYVGSADHNLYAIDRENGEDLFSVETGEAVLSSPAVTGDAVFVGSSDSLVYAVGSPGDGESPDDSPAEGTDPAPDGSPTGETTADDGQGFGALGALGALGLGTYHRIRSRGGTDADAGPGSSE